MMVASCHGAPPQKRKHYKHTYTETNCGLPVVLNLFWVPVDAREECLALNPHALEFVPTQMRIDVAFQAAAKSQISPEEATKLPAPAW